MIRDRPGHRSDGRDVSPACRNSACVMARKIAIGGTIAREISVTALAADRDR
jgi:hypothetical protein